MVLKTQDIDTNCEHWQTCMKFEKYVSFCKKTWDLMKVIWFLRNYNSFDYDCKGKFDSILVSMINLAIRIGLSALFDVGNPYEIDFTVSLHRFHPESMHRKR